MIMNTHNNFGSSHEQPQGGGQAAHEASTRRSETFVLLLTLLEDESAHAVMLNRRVEQVSDTSLEPGTFYGALARLEKDGLVGVSSRNVSARVYSLTERGQEALQRHRYILQERRERLEPAARESFFKERTMR